MDELNLLDRLRETSSKDKNKKNVFTSAQLELSYPTEFLPFDFKNGQYIHVNGNGKNETYAYLGIPGGKFLTVVGKSGVAKTSWVVSVAWNIVKNIENSFVYHFDLESSTSITRIMNLTGATQEELNKKYILKRGTYLEDIYETIYTIAKTKKENPNKYTYIAPVLDEFGQQIVSFIPTVIIIDSTASITSNSVTFEEMPTQTEAMRTAQKIKQFYKMLIPLIESTNIIVLSINHINDKPMTMVKTQAQIMYAKQDISMPGGYAPIYYASTLLAFFSVDKFNMNDDGFDGFAVRAEFWKSRTNKANQSCTLIFDMVTGFDPVRTLLRYADEQGLLDGRNPYKYFKGYPDKKFSTKKFNELFIEDPEIRDIVKSVVMPSLYSELSDVTEEKRIEKKSVDMLGLL
jgi:archaellum biogenesis ATPase FlaH